MHFEAAMSHIFIASAVCPVVFVLEYLVLCDESRQFRWSNNLPHGLSSAALI